MIGRTLSHYRILGKVGAGGMGEVYSARDERLERDIALKILPSGALADEAARKRFRKEALALSRLNHPNIATIYDFDTDTGVDFIAMEYVNGETLTDKAAGKALSDKEVAALGAQIADALEEAHEHGIIHRDLKPGNIMVTPKGRIKVLDFGLAKLLRPAGNLAPSATMSETQGVAGTLPYMAPEQLRDEPADPRSDLFSLGAVLYETTTGQLPFNESISSRLTDAILHRAPAPPRALNSRLSPELERIILKCLEKEPELRYQSAKELGVDLRRLGAPTALAASTISKSTRNKRRRVAAASGVAIIVLLAIFTALNWNFGRWRDQLRGATKSRKIESLAVLPLANLSADPAQEYFADGMTEELTTELAQISGLRVISRTSTMRYKGTQKPIPDIANELGVDAVIEGSVERSAEQVRISAQLINARTDSHLWARSYQRNLRDVLAMQSEVARAIAKEVQVQLTPREQTRLERPRPVDPAAYEAYLKGRYASILHTGDGLQKAIAEYQHAIQLDPSYALAYVGLSQAYFLLTVNADARPQDVLPKAKEAALKAVELDPQLGEAHSSLAFVLGQNSWDWKGGEREYRRAIELTPNLSEAHSYYGQMLIFLGRHSEALSEAERAQELDPMSNHASFALGMTYQFGRQYDRAVQAYTQSLEINPNFWPSHIFLGEVYEQQGRYAAALAELQKGQGPTLEARAAMAHVYAVSGEQAQAERILGELIMRSKKAYLPPTYIAKIYAALGQKDQAFAWLEKGYAMQEVRMGFIAVDPMYDSLRSDPRLTDLLRRLNLAR